MAACVMILILGYALILINLIKTPFKNIYIYILTQFFSLNASVNSLTSLLPLRIAEIALIEKALKFHLRY